MKVLFLTSQLPYPAVSGGVIKSNKLLSHLSAIYDVTLCCFLKNTEEEKDLAIFKADNPQLGISTESLALKRTPINLLKSYLSGVPLTIYRNQSPSFKATIDGMANGYDAIFVDHYLMFQYVPADYQGRVIVHQHNAEFVMWSRFARHISNPIKKLIVYIEGKRIRRYEVAMCSLANVVLAAPNDQQQLVLAGVKQSKFVDTLHLGDENNLLLPDIEFEKTNTSLLFIGTLTWEANAHGLLWFLKNSWPQIKKEVEGVTFTIVGIHSEKLRKKILKLSPEVQLSGFVENLEEIYPYHRVFVAPIRFGSGNKVKVANSLYRGIPTVTTSVGAEGFNLNHGEHLMIEDSPADFADSVVRLLKNKAIWQKCSRQSREVMRKNYRWDGVLKNARKSFKDDDPDGHCPSLNQR